MASILKIKRLNTIFIIYWVLLAYIVAALIWWFIALNQQNKILSDYKLQQLKNYGYSNQSKVDKISEDKRRKKVQYLGEGITFLLLIIAGAVFIFRAAKRQLKQTRQQQNFMMAITHELKTPIAVTKLNLETLQKHELPQARQQRLINNTLQEANRLNDLLNNLLLTSQIEAGKYHTTNEKIALSSLVQSSVHEFTTRYPTKKIEANIENEIYFIADSLLFQMAVNNILDNAIKYSPRESKIAIDLKTDNHHILLNVKDEGNGIADEEKSKIFNKFYRIGNMHTKGSKGTGLGLFLTKKIVEQSRGFITVSDNTPRGSVFTISINKNG